MKKIVSIIAAIFVVLAMAVPAFAAAPPEECQHLHAFESEGRYCPDCGVELYKCEECGTAFCASDRECPSCNAKNKELANSIINDKERYIGKYVFGILLGALFIIFIIVACKAVGSYIFLIFEVCPVALIVYLIVDMVKTYQLVAPFI